jgi:hypothetical protein
VRPCRSRRRVGTAAVCALALACGDAPEPAPPDPSADQARLEALGYLAASRPAPTQSGVTVDDARAWPGVNLYISGHAPEAILLAMDGRELHRWRHPFWGVHKRSESDPMRDSANYWRRAELGPGGTLVAIYDGHGLVKLDRDSHPLYQLDLPAHHDLALLPDGGVVTLIREPREMPAVDASRPTVDDLLVFLDAGGRELRRISLIDAILRSEHAPIFDRRDPHRRYPLHTNGIELLDGRLAAQIPAFRAGNVLISMLGLDTLVVLDPESEQIVWALNGEFEDQHDPSVLANGRLLLFDNIGLGLGASRLLELDPTTGAMLWSYHGTETKRFFTRWCGAVEALPNGNRLASETEAGRAFEVTPSGEIVWEFFNPHRAGAQNELVAALFELRRYPPEAARFLEAR